MDAVTEGKVSMTGVLAKLKEFVTDIKVWITAAVVAVAEYAFNLIDLLQTFFT
jgi:hypothetical protein